MSLTKLQEKLIEDISKWSKFYDFDVTFEHAKDLTGSLINTIKGTLLEINNLPKTDKDDEEHYQ